MTPKPTAAHPPLPEAPPKPKNYAPLPSVPAQDSTPWPGTGKMSRNLFQDRKWLLPPNYLENKTKNEPKAVTSITSPKPQIKEEESNKMNNPQGNVDGDWVVHSANPKNRRKIKARSSNRSWHLKQKSKLQDQKL